MAHFFVRFFGSVGVEGVGVYFPSLFEFQCNLSFSKAIVLVLELLVIIDALS